MNDKLLELEKMWYEQIIKAYVEKGSIQNISIPYFMGVAEEYEKSNNRIMIVGQEPYDFPPYNENIDIKKSQKWAINYIQRQVYNGTKYEKNNSPFWNAFRKIQKYGFDTCWNNIINFHQIIDGKTVPLTSDMRKCNQVKVINNKTLLQAQIDITDPKVIWFVTGPAYADDMAGALQVDSEELKMFLPCSKNYIQNISHLIKGNKGIKYYWSYHPKYLQVKKKLDEVIEKIK